MVWVVLTPCLKKACPKGPDSKLAKDGSIAQCNWCLDKEQENMYLQTIIGPTAFKGGKKGKDKLIKDLQREFALQLSKAGKICCYKCQTTYDNEKAVAAKYKGMWGPRKPTELTVWPKCDIDSEDGGAEGADADESEEEFGEAEASMNDVWGGIGNLGDKIDKKIQALNEKIDNEFTKMNEKIDAGLAEIKEQTRPSQGPVVLRGRSEPAKASEAHKAWTQRRSRSRSPS